MWFLDHYFRHLYRIFKYIDDADKNTISDEDKYEYAGIVRATLSQYELIMLCILIMPGREYRKPVASGFRKEKSEVRT